MQPEEESAHQADLRDLYLSARHRLVIQVAALTRDVAEAEDCVQDAFARAVPRWSKIRRYENPEAWVCHVALNLARSRWRSHLRRRVREGVVADTSQPLPEDHLDLLAALRALQRDQRDAVVLHHLLGHSLIEIAERQGVAIGTVKARLSRGRQALAELLHSPETRDEEKIHAENR
jgi:RNA polymerase sigma-70 factor, ECF subfamily